MGRELRNEERNKRPMRRTLLGGALAAAALPWLGACAGPGGRDVRGGPGANANDGEVQNERLNREAQARAFGERGYPRAQRYEIEPLREQWNVDGDDVTLLLDVPRNAPPAPVLLYLPGLGEPAESGAAWRRWWAQSGYAVASVQGAASGRAVWMSPSARSAEFAQIARDQFGDAALVHRVLVARSALERFAARADARIDARRIAVAGFDLGAQTALALAGERAPATPPQPPIDALRAVVALSPYAARLDPSASQRYAGVHAPVCCVTGTEDIDSYGLVNAPAQRRLPFRMLPAGDKYLLTLEGATHTVIGGNIPAEDADAGNRAASRRNGRNGGSGGGTDSANRRGPGGTEGGFGGGFPGGGGPAGGGFGGGPGGTGDLGGPGGEGERDMRDAATPAQPNYALHLVAEQHATLAFLDATVRDDPVAREWLERDIARWVGQLGTWQAR